MCVIIVGLSAAPVTVTSTYVEARTSEIFAGACAATRNGSTRWRPSTTPSSAVAVENAFSGASLGTTWSDPNKRSAFFGTFAYSQNALCIADGDCMGG